MLITSPPWKSEKEKKIKLPKNKIRESAKLHKFVSRVRGMQERLNSSCREKLLSSNVEYSSILATPERTIEGIMQGYKFKDSKLMKMYRGDPGYDRHGKRMLKMFKSQIEDSISKEKYIRKK